MLGLNCLINDTRVAQDIKDAISLLVGERAELNKAISFPVVYNELRNAGLEVDAESAGSLYNELYGNYNDAALSTEDEILEYVGKDVVNQQNAIVDAMAGVTPTINENQIGKLPPEKQVATMIAKMFQEATFGATKNVNSVMKQMENLVAKAAKTLLPASAKNTGKTLYDNLNDFFATEAVQFETLSGGVNTLQTLHDAVKNEVDNYLAGISDKLTDDEVDALNEKWANYTNAFIQSTYDIMLGKSDQNKLLNDALKQVEVDGLQIVDVNNNVKWSALMEDNRPDRIGEGVKKLFQNGIKDEAGNVQKYSAEQASRIGDYFQKLYEKKLAAVVQQKAGNERSKNESAKNIVSDFIKDRGFINLVKDKNGELLLTQTNWDEALKEMKLRVGDKAGIDSAVQELRKFLAKKKNKQGDPYTPRQIDIIEKAFRDTVAAKLVPATATPHAIQRLIALKNLNHGKAFEQSTQSALNNVLGVADLDQNTINRIKELTEVAQSIVMTNNVTGSSSNDSGINRGAYAYQALSQIDRKIREIVRENKISRSQRQRIVKYVGDAINAASSSLLLNPGNFGENILTGFASNLGESVLMGFTNPKLYSKFGGDFWTAFGSHFSGGVSNEVISDQDITADVQSGERLRFSQWGKEFSKGWKGVASALIKSPAYTVAVVNRMIMNSFDAGFNSSILRKKAALSTYRALLGQGLTADEAINTMLASLDIDPKTEQEIDSLNKEITRKLKSVGINPTIADMAQNKRDLKLSLYEDTLASAALQRGKNVTARQVAQSSKALIEAAATQAKVLTGKRQIPITGFDFVNKAIYGAADSLLKVQRENFQEQQQREERGELRSAANAQARAEIWKNTIGRFAGGIANFMALATTVTPYGYITARSLQIQKNRLVRENPNAADVFSVDPGEVRKYAEYHNLVRSMVLRASMGTLAIGGFVMKRLFEDDEDETFVGNLMQTKSGRRLLQKYLPLGINVAASILYDVEDKKFDTAMERLIDVLGNTTGQSYDKWSGIKTAISRAKDDDDRWKAGASFIGGSLPTLNINQGEQITKFWNVVKSAYDKENISAVERDEEISKAIYKEAETAADVIMTNGAVDAFKRIFGKDKKYNRFKEED